MTLERERKKKNGRIERASEKREGAGTRTNASVVGRIYAAVGAL